MYLLHQKGLFEQLFLQSLMHFPSVKTNKFIKTYYSYLPQVNGLFLQSVQLEMHFPSYESFKCISIR